MKRRDVELMLLTSAIGKNEVVLNNARSQAESYGKMYDSKYGGDYQRAVLLYESATYKARLEMCQEELLQLKQKMESK